MEKIDVIVRTLNSEKTIKCCLDSLSRYCPLNKVILVDGESSDRTIKEVMESTPGKNGMVKVFVKPELSLGESFFFGLNNATTDIVGSVDSDVFIKEGWFSELSRHLNGNSAVVEGGAIEHYEIPFVFNNEKHRGNMCNIIGKRDVLMKVKEEKLHVREDAYLKWYIERILGFEWKKAGTLLADHFSSPVRYDDGKSYLFVRRMRIPTGVCVQAGQADRLMKNKGRMLKGFGVCIFLPLKLFADLFKEQLFYVVGWLKKN